MKKISQKQQKIVAILLEKDSLSSSDIHAELLKRGEETSLVTVKRSLSDMVSNGLLVVIGSGPATSYRVSTVGRIYANVDAKAYGAIEPDRRYGSSQYNFDLLPSFPVDIFLDEEMQALEEASFEYYRRTADLPEAIQKKRT